MHGTLGVLQQHGGSSLTPGEGGGPGGVHVSGQSKILVAVPCRSKP